VLHLLGTRAVYPRTFSDSGGRWLRRNPVGAGELAVSPQVFRLEDGWKIRPGSGTVQRDPAVSPPVLTLAAKARHCRGPKARVGPPGFLLSRTAMMPGRLDATSTHSACPSPPGPEPPDSTTTAPARSPGRDGRARDGPLPSRTLSGPSTGQEQPAATRGPVPLTAAAANPNPPNGPWCLPGGIPHQFLLVPESHPPGVAPTHSRRPLVPEQAATLEGCQHASADRQRGLTRPACGAAVLRAAARPRPRRRARRVRPRG
jgi:hypothetical protein